MAEDSEKRFIAVMDKLFHAPPKSKPSSSATKNSGGQLSGGKKRNPWSALTAGELKSSGYAADDSQKQSKPVQPPPCRPWDRGDLFRRLATFKSMTWFAKPQAVSAINCARRGWVNVDVDTIVCEACGARLLVSTPQAWTQQQVEKTALVYSLKLDSGHKLLCPWVDNICDENLARFPPKQTAVLVDDYKKRCSALLQILALPVISSSVTGYMRSPQLEQFLQNHLVPTSTENPESCHLGNQPDSVSTVSYYQAQKLISLCGWDLHPLTYTVGCKEAQNQLIRDGYLDKTSDAVPYGVNRCISVLQSSPDGSMEGSDGKVASGELEFDPNSVVLDCQLCGARVGLWAFSTIPRPMEFLRLVGHTEVNGGSNMDHYNSNSDKPTDIASVGTEFYNGPSKLKLTIAGGPPPTKQNYRAVISLPLVGRNLRARFSSESNTDDLLNVQNLSEMCKDQNMLIVSGSESTRGTSQSGEANYIPETPSTSSQIAVQDSCNTDGIAGNERVRETAFGVGKQFSSLDESDSYSSPGEKGIPLVPSNRKMEFDPIRQHRPFCPWITPNGNSAPGWQQTLSALQRHKEFSIPLHENTSTSLIEVDDPIESVRKLFTPPSSKRTKFSHQAKA